MKQTMDEIWWPSRYGAHDQHGSLNEITPFEGRYWQQTLVSSSHIINPRRPDGQPDGWGQNRINWITELVTGTMQMGTHLDALNHLQIGDRFYNGFQLKKSMSSCSY